MHAMFMCVCVLFISNFPVKFLCLCVLTTYCLCQGGPTRTSADVSVPRLAGFSLIT
jgi:hypothetical protein